MQLTWILACAIAALVPTSAPAQWRAADDGVAPATASSEVVHPAQERPRHGPLIQEKAAPQLPNAAGQVWRQYDIRDYTERRAHAERPEQAIVDWILRETGTDLWFTPPLGLLNADRTTLHVYHTPEVHKLVEDIVRRFVEGDTAQHVFGVRLITVLNPNWRNIGSDHRQTLAVQTPGVQAWMMSRESAAVLLEALRGRADYREHNTPSMVVQSGQMHTIERIRPLAYVRDLLPRGATVVPGLDVDMGQVEEGFKLELSPLLSADGRFVDAVVKLETCHVEALTPVWVDTPAPTRARQTTQIQVPQTASWRMHERFRWPADQVLLVSCGFIANPGAERKSGPGLAAGLLAGPSRAEALVMLEAKGALANPLSEPRTAVHTDGINYRGRY